HSDSLSFISGTTVIPFLGISYAATGTKMLLGNVNTSLQLTDSNSVSYWVKGPYQGWVQVQSGSNVRCNGYLVMASDLGGCCSTTVKEMSGLPGVASQLYTVSALNDAFSNRGDIVVGDAGNAVLLANYGGRVT